MSSPAQLPGCASSTVSPREIRHAAVCRQIAAEGMVLLKNDGILPLAADAETALYGAGARHTIKGGTGSGSVNNRYAVSIDEGLRQAGIRITNTAWLDDFDARRTKAREAWMQSLYAMSRPDDPESLYRAYASHPMPAPLGGEITGGDADTAIYVISRISGEGADRTCTPGDYLLSENEQTELETVCRLYRHVIVILNVGGIIDLSFMDTLPISALVLMSQAGMEGGNALADVLTGRIPFSGHLSDSWPMHYEDLPGSAHFSHNDGNVIREYYTEDIYVGYRYFDTFIVHPRYPFGYGLSLTSFEEKTESVQVADGMVCVSVRVTNTGSRPGRQVLQLYAACPCGLRAKEHKRLIAFAKTAELAPGASEELLLKAPLRLLASFHTGKASWYLDAGNYTLLLGTSSDATAPVGRLTLKETVFLHRTGNILPLQDALKTISPDPKTLSAWQAMLDTQAAQKQLPALPLEPELDAVRAQLAPVPVKKDIFDSRAQEILSELTEEEKAVLCVGRMKQGPAEFIGNAGVRAPGAAGETAPVLENAFGIRGAVMADGPAGLRLQQHLQYDPETLTLVPLSRMQQLENRFFGKEFLKDGMIDRYQFASAVPVGTLLAQTFDLRRVREIGCLIAAEMQELHVELWLAPGMNIHRNPLCGRNFEYFSEDPLLSGCMAAALTEGVQASKGCAVTIKHFACNNQEENRRGVSSVVSERALREIYLLGFELCVRTAHPGAIMTSYNKINGVHTANSHDLLTRTAREQWGFDGVIMTDWTTTNMNGGASAAKCVAAGNDLTMPGRLSDVREILDALHETGDQSLSMEDLDACARRVIAAALRLGCDRE